MTRPTSSNPFYKYGLLVVVLVAFGLRFGALLATQGIAPLFDEQLYLLRGEALLSGEGFVGSYQSWVLHDMDVHMADLPQYTGSYQPPLYTVFIAAIFSITNHSVFAVKLAQVVISTLTICLIFWIARSWFCRQTALMTAGFCAIYPTLIAFSHYLWTETLFIFFLTLAFGLLVTSDTALSKKRCVAAGCTLALAVLTRATILYFIPVLFAWVVLAFPGRRRHSASRVLLAGIVMCAVLVPWVVRNYQVHGAIVLVDTNGSFNVWRGNAGKHVYLRRPRALEYSYARPFESIPLMPVRENREPEVIGLAKQRYETERPTDIQIAETAKHEAIKNIKGDLRYFALAGWYKMIDMWNPTSFLVRHLRIGRYGAVRPEVQQAIRWAAVLTYCLAMLLLIPGVLLNFRNPHVWLIVLLIGFFCAVHAMAFGLTRFRLPLMPFIIMLSAAGVTRALGGVPKEGPEKVESIAASPDKKEM